MTITYVIFAASAVLFGGSAVLGLVWAVRKGQFENFHRGAASIFDADEPVGRMTDAFPPSRRTTGPSGRS